MKHILNISILVILVAGLFSAEIDLSAVDIGDRSRKAVTDMNESLDKLSQQYFEATEKVKADAVKNLEKERSRTKDGLVALGIQYQIDQIGKMAPPIDLLGNPIKKAFDTAIIVGEWKVTHNRGWSSSWTFLADGTISDTNNVSIATWSLNPAKDGIIIKEGTRTHVMGLPSDNFVWTGTDAEGRSLLFSKIK